MVSAKKTASFRHLARTFLPGYIERLEMFWDRSSFEFVQRFETSPLISNPRHEIPCSNTHAVSLQLARMFAVILLWQIESLNSNYLCDAGFFKNTELSELFEVRTGT